MLVNVKEKKSVILITKNLKLVTLMLGLLCHQGNVKNAAGFAAHKLLCPFNVYYNKVIGGVKSQSCHICLQCIISMFEDMGFINTYKIDLQTLARSDNVLFIKPVLKTVCFLFLQFRLYVAILKNTLVTSMLCDMLLSCLGQIKVLSLVWRLKRTMKSNICNIFSIK